MKKTEVPVNTEEIEDYLFEELVSKGLAPTGDEINLLAHIVFDFLIEKEIIEEEV